MDPILEEMQRVKSPADIKPSRYRDWVQHLRAVLAAKDEEIQALREANTSPRGPGRPKNCPECGRPETRHAETCGQWMAVARG